MNTKLTLSLDKEIIARAKAYAKENNVSISSLVENFLLKITNETVEADTASGSIANELCGVLELNSETENHKQEYTDYLMEKYK